MCQGWKERALPSAPLDSKSLAVRSIVFTISYLLPVWVTVWRKAGLAQHTCAAKSIPRGLLFQEESGASLSCNMPLEYGYHADSTRAALIRRTKEMDFFLWQDRVRYRKVAESRQNLMDTRQSLRYACIMEIGGLPVLWKMSLPIE